MKSLLAQDVHYDRSHFALGRTIATGTQPVTFDQMSIFNVNEFRAPNDLPLLAIPLTGGIIAKGPHPNAAKLFIAFAFSKDAQSRLIEERFYPARQDIDIPQAWRDLLKGPVDYGYLAFLRNSRKADVLRRQFKVLIGEPTGDYNKSVGR